MRSVPGGEEDLRTGADRLPAWAERHNSRTITRHARVPRLPRGPVRTGQSSSCGLVGMALTAYLSWAASSGSGLGQAEASTAGATRFSPADGRRCWARRPRPGACSPTAPYAARLRPARRLAVDRDVDRVVRRRAVQRLPDDRVRHAARRDVSLLPHVARDHDRAVRGGDEPAAGRDARLSHWRRLLLRAAPAAALVIALLHLNYVGVLGRPPAVEDPFERALALHLSQRGAKMYGAYWCPHCVEQKELFGASAQRLPYVECGTGGRLAPGLGVRGGRIRQYATWIIGGQRYQEVLTLTRLAELTAPAAGTDDGTAIAGTGIGPAAR